MYVLITYDIETTSEKGQSRLRKVAKACVNHGQRVQNSVFECMLDYSEFIRLKLNIASIIDVEKDSVRFYILGNNWDRRIERMGKETSFKMDGELII